MTLTKTNLVLVVFITNFLSIIIRRINTHEPHFITTNLQCCEKVLCESTLAAADIQRVEHNELVGH